MKKLKNGYYVDEITKTMFFNLLKEFYKTGEIEIPEKDDLVFRESFVFGSYELENEEHNLSVWLNLSFTDPLLNMRGPVFDDEFGLHYNNIDIPIDYLLSHGFLFKSEVA